MKRIIGSTLVLLAVSSCVLAQTYAEKEVYSNLGFQKIRKIDILYNVLPVLYTKDQLNALLPAIEKARDNIRKVRENEYSVYRGFDVETEACIKDAIEKNILPSRELRGRLTQNLRAMDATRRMFYAVNIKLVRDVFEKVLNRGQKKTAMNTLDPRSFDPNAKPEEMTDTQKEDLYIREILLDDLTYGMLVQMAKYAH